MTKRDNELTRPELLDKRVKQLLEKWEVHRGQLPQDLITALEGVRKAHEMPWEYMPKDPVPIEPHHSAFPDPVFPGLVKHPVDVAGVDVVPKDGPAPVVSEPVPAVAPDAPAKPGDLT